MNKNSAGEGRGNTSVGSTISSARIKADQAAIKAGDMRMDTGLSAWSLCTAQVLSVDYETLRCRIRIMSGTMEEPIHDGVPLTFPGGGRRHFFGSMPNEGDYCLVGWSSGNSDGLVMARLPRILGFFPAPSWLGRDWVVAQEYSPDEMPGGGDHHRMQLDAGAYAARVRFKARHIEAGNIVASSSQGADLVLDESVTLANRRGNELLLRDQDQAMVFRSLNQFHAMSGARVYAGQIQRDARYLPPEMFCDGTWWDSPNLFGMSEANLAGQSPDQDGYLTPGLIFQRNESASSSDFELEEGTYSFATSINPFHFLRFGSYITTEGLASDVADPDGMAVVGGKAFYRVAPLLDDSGNYRGSENAALTDREALTEYRIEVAHESDGTLPVTEQTDGFDAERLPSSTGGATSNSPFVEVVYGSVIGNDPFSGRSQYGVPLAPKINPSPMIDSGFGKPVLEHAATLFRVRPLDGGSPTWVSVNKAGKVFASLPRGLDLNIGGSSYNFGSQGGVGIQTPGVLNLSGDGVAGPPDGFGVNIESSGGAVRIYGGQMATLGANSGDSPSSNEESPNVLIEGRENVLIKANNRIALNARVLDLGNIQRLVMASQNQFSLQSGDVGELSSNNVRIGSQESLQLRCTARDPLKDPGFLHTITANPSTGYIPFTPSYKVEQMTGGSYDFMTSMGNWATTVLVGNQTYNSVAGNVTQMSLGGSNMTMVGPAGYTANVGVGAYTANAVAGPATVTGSVGANLISTAGPTVARSSSALLLGAPTPVPGPLLTGGCLDPLFGLPYLTLTLCDSGAVRTP